MSEETTEFAAFEIETARLVLRHLDTADVATMAKLANDEAVVSMTARLPFPYAESDARSFIELAQGYRRDGELRGIAVRRRTDDAFLGCIGLERRTDGTADLGYWLGRLHWGQGFATEAARALIDHAFEGGDIPAITAACRVINEASRRVLEKCGLRYVTSGLTPAPARGGAFPVDRFRLTHRDWESFKAWRPAVVRGARRGVEDAMA